MPKYFALNPDRVGQLGLEITRKDWFGDASLWPGLAAHVEASHKATVGLLDYLQQLANVPNGVQSEQERLALSYKAAQQAGTVLRATRKRLEQEAKDLAGEVKAEQDAYWRDQLPDTATRLRAMEMFAHYVAQGKLDMVNALMSEPALASVLATTNRRLIHENLTQTYQDSVTRTALKKFQPDIIAKAEKVDGLLDMVEGHTKAIRIMDTSVSNATAANDWDSRVQPPVMPEPVAA